MSDLKQQLATIVENAIQNALRTYESPQGIGEPEVIGLALGAAESVIEQFHVVAKDQGEYAICEWNDYYAEPSRGSYIGGWVPVQKQDDCSWS